MNKSILSIALVLTVAATSAQAERRNILDRTVINATANGSITRQIERRPTDSGATREVTRTNAQGETATRSSAMVRDNEAGIATRTVSGVAFDGTSYAGERVISRTENGLERTSNYSDSAGNSRSGSGSLTVDKEAGTISKEMSATRTNSAGETTSVSGESLLARTEDGFTRNSSHTDANGNTRTHSADVSVNKDEGSLTKTVTASGPNGQASTTTNVKRERSVDAAE